MFGPYRFDQSEAILHRNGTEISVPPKALGVLQLLLERRQSTVSKQDLLSAVWNGTAVTDHSLTEAVRTLRQVLGDDPQKPLYVQTVHGRGYRFIAEVHAGGDGAASLSLDEVASAGADSRGRETAAGSGMRSRRLAWTLGGATLIALAAGVLWQFRHDGTPDSRPVVRFSLSAPAKWAIPAGREGPRIAVSPDGKTIAYYAWSRELALDGLHLVSTDDLETRRVPLSENRQVRQPFFSPDGQQLGFFSRHGLEVISLADGEIRTVCGECSDGTRRYAGATWGADGTIVFANGKLFQLPAGGATPLPVPAPDPAGNGVYLWPSFLPDSASVLVTIAEDHTIHNARIAVVSLATGATRVVIEDGTNARYVSTGHVVFARDGDLVAVPFDVDRLEASGEAVVVVPGVMMDPLAGAAQFSISDDGTLLYQPGAMVGRQARLVSADREGNLRIVSDDLRDYGYLVFSPDGRWLAAEITGRGRNIWLYDIARRTWDQLTDGGAEDFSPAWSPDGTQLAFGSNRDGVHGVYAMPVDRSRPPERIMAADHELWPRSWSPSGILAVTTLPAKGEYETWMVAVDGSVEPEFFGPSIWAMFSPNGHWIAYDDNRVDEANLYISPYPGTGARTRVTDEVWNMNAPQWAPDGRSLYFYMDRLYVVGVETGPSLRIGELERLPFGSFFYAVSPTDQEIVLAKRMGPRVPSTTHLNVVRNWFEELQRLVPVER